MTNLAVRGPTIPISERQVTERRNTNRKKYFSVNFDNSAKYANTMPAGEGGVTSEDIKKKLLSGEEGLSLPLGRVLNQL